MGIQWALLVGGFLAGLSVGGWIATVVWARTHSRTLDLTREVLATNATAIDELIRVGRVIGLPGIEKVETRP